MQILIEIQENKKWSQNASNVNVIKLIVQILSLFG